MRSTRRTEVSLKNSAQQLSDHNISTDLTTAWKHLAQSKAALRHIENHLEAAPGTGVLLDSVMDPPKKKTSRMVRCKEADDNGGSSKRRGHSQQSSEKSSSHSPLRSSIQDRNVCRNNSVEFREPLASYREATPPSSQLEAYSLHSAPGSLYPSSPPPLDPLLSELVYQRDTRDKQTDRDLDSTHTSALESTEVHYLNDWSALDAIRTVGKQSHLTGVRAPAREGAEEKRTSKAQLDMNPQGSSPGRAEAPGAIHRGESTPSTSPGSASQRLENLRRHQPDNKLERLKERIRRQRQHLEEAAEREKLQGYLEQPINSAVGNINFGTCSMPTAKIRKVAAAPPAPTYKGFNSTETKIQTSDGKVWKEDEFHNLSREIYKDLSQQIAENTRSRHQQQRETDSSKERRPPKLVRKVHRATPASDLHAKPVINPASWREGQKLVKMVLGPIPKKHTEDSFHPADKARRTASRHRSRSDPHSESLQQTRPNNKERLPSGFQEQSKSYSTSTSTHTSAAQDKAPVGISTDLLSADIQGILDDLQLECKQAENADRARERCRGGSRRRGRGGSGSRTRTPISAWGTAGGTGSSLRECHSASPTRHQPETANMADSGHKKRHYDADIVRHYIARQREERKRCQAEEKRALREEAERRNQRLQELYRKQREVAKTLTLASEAPVIPVQKRLQGTYTKLLSEEAQLGDDDMEMQPATLSIQMRPIYQPSGESDKENKRVEAPQSPSSSDRSLNDQPPLPLYRNDLDGGVGTWLYSDRLSPAVHPVNGPSTSVLAPFGGHFLTQFLRLEKAVATSDIRHTQQPATASSNRLDSKMSRIEALKATAASLSNRIESEARKLVGGGINYGTATSMDMDNILAPGPSQANGDDECWAKVAATENNDVAFRIQKILTRAGQSSYNGTTLPAAGKMYALKGQKEKKGVHTNLSNPQTTSDVTGPSLHSYTPKRGKLVNGLENTEEIDKMSIKIEYDKEDNQTNIHDSSAGSISEGPILSEGSFSEDEGSPPHPSIGHVSRAVDHLDVTDFCAGQKMSYQRLSEFQKEAEGCSGLNSPFAQHENNKAAWEELNKGSPLSVINIFTKNFHGQVQVSDKNSPSAHLLSGKGPSDAVVYEDDFVSSHSSRASGQLRKSSNSPSHYEELIKRSPLENSAGGINSQHSSFHSSIHSPHLSSGSASGSSPLSKHSRKRGITSDQSDATLVEEQRSSSSPPSEAYSSDSKKRGSDKSFTHSQAKSDTLGETSWHSHQSLLLDDKKSRGARPKQTSPTSPDHHSPIGLDSPNEPARGGSLGTNYVKTATTARNGVAEPRTTGELQYSPAVLQQRMAAELQYLESIEESVRQLDNMEKLIGVSMAQQESASLAQMLKAKQQQHERDLYELKIKTEREALETQLQVEENRQRVAKAHIELQESMAVSQKETLEGLQEASAKMMSQQAEAAQYTVDAARHIKEMTELARSQIAGALFVPPVPTNSSMLGQEEEQLSSFRKQRQAKVDSDSFHSEVSSERTGSDEVTPSLNKLSHSDALSFRRPKPCETDSISYRSPSNVLSDHREKEGEGGQMWKGKADRRTKSDVGSSSTEVEVHTAANISLCSDSIPSVVDEKDSTSIATEYSLKFEESMTEDEIEERSFRSLLPSEAHRRESIEKKSRHHDESEDDVVNHNTTVVSDAHNILKDVNIAFSSGQDSFSQFTMDMVRQYMKDEEVRLQHQSFLLRLRQKALKEKTRTELAWLEHQKKKLRDKGEDDKMPPIRKRQRGLLMKLQQEQAEIKRLQEANKAAMKERQLLLKQQEEIERMRNSTFRLKERLKSAGNEAPPETPVSETLMSEPPSPNMKHANDNRSTSPSLSISGSETSSIMQKLKKMHSHMDEKNCSPVHYFFSVFTAHHWASLSVCLPNLHPKFQLFIYNQLVRFLTKREQQLMQRRHHAEELLNWKQRLDQEEAEVCRMEKEALAVWDRQKSEDKDGDISKSPKNEISNISFSLSHCQSSKPRNDSGKEHVRDSDCSSVTPETSIHTEELGCQEPESPSSVLPVSVPDTPLASAQSSPASYIQDFTSVSNSSSRQSPVFKGSHSRAASPSDGTSKTKMQLHSSSRTIDQDLIQPSDSPIATQTEPISDQSDIESRIKALKEELRKRKFMAYQLKKEQKKRQKERLKAQEASLLKQLETYNNIIEKTKAELNKEPDSTSESQSVTESSLKPSAPRSETSKIAESTFIDASLDRNASQHNHSRSTSVPEELSADDSPTVILSPVHGNPECQTSVTLLRPALNEARAQIIKFEDENVVSDQRSDIQEEQKVEVSFRLEDEHSEHLLKLEYRHDSQEKLSRSQHVPSSMNEDQHSPSEVEDAVKPITKSHPAAVKKTSPHPSYKSIFNDPFCSPDSELFPLKKGAPMKDAEASSSLASDYHDDFESLVYSSPREEHHSSKADSRLIKGSRKDSPIKATQHDSQDEETEKEIAEELSHHSGRTDSSHQSTPLSTVTDEMPSFSIGDRVLVGGVQPGTLRFKGPTSFANGFWAGVELDKSEGSNNGTYDGVVYFECDECHGIFAPPDKISLLPDKFEIYTDTTEDEESFFDDLLDKGGDKPKTNEDKSETQRNLKSEKEQTCHKDFGSDNKLTDDSVHNSQAPLKAVSHFSTENHKEFKLPISNGNTTDIILNSEDVPTTILSPDVDKISLGRPSKKVITAIADRNNSQDQFTPADLTTVIENDKGEQKDTDLLDTFADNLFNNFVKDTVKQFAEIQKAKEEKIEAANQMFGVNVEENEWASVVEQKDGLPFFLPAEKDELSSPELCTRPKSPVLGASGQEELAKRLAELELSRELLDDFGDDQDWFDEDFGLSSRREQQRLKQKQREEEEEARLGGGGLGRSGSSGVAPKGGLSSSPGGEQQLKTPPRPELPLLLPPKLPEQPAMVVPHSAAEVEKMVYAVIQEIWQNYDLGKEGALLPAQVPNPKPLQDYLGKDASSQDQEALSIRSYRKAVYDLTWEILQEIFAEDPKTDQPQWVKPQRPKSSFFHRVKTTSDLNKIQKFISAEVLKMYGLAKDQSQKTDWQKMLKFGRKKRDRVDHILVQELHEEEAQWVNYDEDELYVKMQLADSIFDALLKDTASVLTLICDKRP
ncbi:centrosome-associated protein 350 isoform X3 [Channa argus]|uniref:centrosome-associated protein 350 isoform X3 n=1 Tax=Channa argus TaxID=215402 RepID=UPI00351FA9D9